MPLMGSWLNTRPGQRRKIAAPKQLSNEDREPERRGAPGGSAFDAFILRVVQRTERGDGGVALARDLDLVAGHLERAGARAARGCGARPDGRFNVAQPDRRAERVGEHSRTNVADDRAAAPDRLVVVEERFARAQMKLQEPLGDPYFLLPQQ